MQVLHWAVRVVLAGLKFTGAHSGQLDSDFNTEKVDYSYTCWYTVTLWRDQGRLRHAHDTKHDGAQRRKMQQTPKLGYCSSQKLWRIEMSKGVFCHFIRRGETETFGSKNAPWRPKAPTIWVGLMSCA